jgi:hypothetical protein
VQIEVLGHELDAVQWQSVHVTRVSCVSPVNTLKNKNIKILLSYFCGSVVLRTLERRRTDHKNESLASSSQPGAVSQIVEAYARRERSRYNTVNMNAPVLMSCYYVQYKFQCPGTETGSPTLAFSVLVKNIFSFICDEVLTVRNTTCI